MRGVAGEGKVIGVPKFGKCTMSLSTQIGCPMLPLACELHYFIYIILRVSFISHVGVLPA